MAGRRGASSGGGGGAAAAAPLYKGSTSTRYEATPTFKSDVGEFAVLQQLRPDGTLVEGVESLPFSAETAVRMYETMVRSEVYDGIMNELQRQGRISFYCTNYGEEAAAVATAAAFEAQDTIWPHYRELGMFLWRGLTAEAMADQNRGTVDAVGKGRNLPVHYCLPEQHVQTVHAVLGTHVPQAAGAGYGFRVRGEDRVAVAYFGDGAASEGDALTALNFAAIFRSQTLFICRNNGYSISTPVSEQYAGDGIAARGPAFGIPSIRVDGNDAAAVYAATAAARRRSVAEGTPVVLELMTYRKGHHTTSDDSSLYRTEDQAELEMWEQMCPLKRLRTYLVRTRCYLLLIDGGGTTPPARPGAPAQRSQPQPCVGATAPLSELRTLARTVPS
jgi:2-oxoisovalerate dehydrogenase E1 component alpha subunit